MSSTGGKSSPYNKRKPQSPNISYVFSFIQKTNDFRKTTCLISISIILGICGCGRFFDYFLLFPLFCIERMKSGIPLDGKGVFVQHMQCVFCSGYL